jgi:hypothetical protein
MTITFNFNKASELFNEILKGCIPVFQLENLKNGVLLNPKLSIAPQQWFVDSFEWFFPLEILPELKYGPFYRVDGDEFWPQVGSPDDIYSENKCFYGFQKPENVEKVKELFGPKSENTMKYVYEFYIKACREEFYNNAMMFIGPIRNAAGFQANPNRTAAKIIQIEIIKNRGVVRYEKLESGDYSLKPEPYIVDM